jgi:TPR repeat protein
MGRLYEDLGYYDLADETYVTCLQSEQASEQRMRTVLCLAALRKRRGDYSQALALWEEAAGEGSVEAFIELAKYYEHRVRDIQAALYWTRAASELIAAPGFPVTLRSLWQAEIEHRLERLAKKNGGNQV